VNRTVRWIRKYIRGSEEQRPEQIRVGDEIMQFLIKRDTSLADALDALTMVMLNALKANYVTVIVCQEWSGDSKTSGRCTSK
jgi:hypothetical protein